MALDLKALGTMGAMSATGGFILLRLGTMGALAGIALGMDLVLSSNAVTIIREASDGHDRTQLVSDVTTSGRLISQE